MRLLHTSDWHLGRVFHGTSLLAQQAAVLDALVQVVRDERVDAVVVAGDLYDRQIPSVDAVALLDQVLRDLRGAGAQIVAIAGNHDSGSRIGFASSLLSVAGVHLVGDPRQAGLPIELDVTDGGAPVVVYPVPYLEPELAWDAIGRDTIGLGGSAIARTHGGVLRAAFDRARADLAARPERVRSIGVAHAFVTGGAPCDSERVLRIGGTDQVGADALSGLDYVALGHLHGRQTIGRGQVRYAGSPLAYSFSEAAHTKGAWLVELSPGGAVVVNAVDLPVPRALATISGELADLLADPAHMRAQGCWVQATLTDQVLPREAMARLRLRFPHAVVLQHAPPVRPGRDGLGYAQRTRGRDDRALVRDFVQHVTGMALTPLEEADCCAAIDAVAVADSLVGSAGR